jgi:N,N-dimethylformamidase
VRAYLSRLSVAPGDVLDVHGSDIPSARAVVREHLHSDPHPDGPGVVVHDCSWGGGSIDAPPVAASLGSYAVLPEALAVGSGFTLSMWVTFTDLGRDAVVASWRSASGAWSLVVADSRLVLEGDGGRHVLDYRIRERTWTFVGIAAGPERVLRPEGATLFASVWGRTGGPFVSGAIDVDALPVDEVLLLGTRDGRAGGLDGRVAGVRVHHEPLDVVELMNVMNGVGAAAAGEWDLADRSDPDAAPSLDGVRAALELVHAPTRSTDVPPCLESAGRPLCGGGSVHFHRDDTEDCGWPVVGRVEVPREARPGIYSLQLLAGPDSYELPFVVSGADEITLLVPTLTWQAYANLGRDETWPGLSHYSLHSDGSPVTVTTSRRPSQTFAPSARLEVDAGDGFATGTNATHLMMADLYAWFWLRREFPDRCGVIDDRDLHSRGADALEGTKVLVLSAHPEYWTSAMLDALDVHLARGGSVVYLGGNGLYWVTSVHPTKPHLMEIRRWGGSQTWSIEETDRRHQFEACTGGLWEDAGRPPNATVGIGFGGFGNGASMVFVRTPESHDARWSWIFDGLGSDVFGGGGLNSGAGNEFDVFDPDRTPPGESVVIASSRPTTLDHFGTFERRGTRAVSADVRCDMVLTLTPAGGLVLAVGSITASGCLTSRRDDGMSQVVRNAVVRMVGTPSG